MITLAFLSVVISIFTWIVSVLPSITLPVSSIAGAFETLHAWINGIGFFVPLDTLGQVITAYILVHLAVLSWHVIVWIIKKVTGH